MRLWTNSNILCRTCAACDYSEKEDPAGWPGFAYMESAIVILRGLSGELIDQLLGGASAEPTTPELETIGLQEQRVPGHAQFRVFFCNAADNVAELGRGGRGIQNGATETCGQ